MMIEPALITGASSGIGLELARIMARNGHELVLAARNKAELERIAAELTAQYGAKVHVVASDLSQPEAPQALYDAVQALGVPVGVLVNNAGFSTSGRFAEIEPSADLNMLALNIVALTHLTRLFLPGMIARKSGRVLNVASTAAFQPGPFMACYYASKAYVLSFSEAIAEELRGTGVTVTTLCPGPTATNFAKRANVEGSPLFASRPVMGAAEVADIGYRATMLGKTVAVAGLMNWLTALSVRFAPRAWIPRIVRALQEPPVA